MNKTCTKCKEVKPLTEFYTHKRDDYMQNCKECVKEHVNKYRIDNMDIIRERKRLYRAKYADKIKKKKSIYQKENKDKCSQRKKVWRKNNPEIYKQCKRRCERKRRAKKREIQENYTTIDEQYTRELFNNCCANCGTTNNLEIDHHYPLSKGNPLTRTNAVVLCRSCNSSKHTKLPEEFYIPEKLQWITEKLSK